MNQHYVPRVYLKNFASEVIQGRKKKKYLVDVFDKQENRFFKPSIKDICSEVDFYTLDPDTKVADDVMVIEKLYSNHIEPLYAKAYELLTDHSIPQITDLQRIELLIGIFQLYPRNPKYIKRAISHHKNEMIRLCKEAKEMGTKGITYLEEDFSFKEYREEDIIAFFEARVKKDFKELHVTLLAEISDIH